MNNFTSNPVNDTTGNAMNTSLIDNLATRGWAACPGYIPPALCARLLSALDAQARAGALAQAGIGREGGPRSAPQVRTDRTLWLADSDPAAADFLALMEGLRADLNRALFLGLFDYEAHYALYAAGGFYKKHRDAFAGQKNRIVSTVAYLTPDWTEADAGHLVLYDPADEDREQARILPAAGTLAVFLSEQIPHEVLPPARPRASIAGWFRCNGSGTGRIDPAH